MNGIDEIWAADLIDMRAFSKHNNGIKYLLTVIDIFSKFAINNAIVIILYGIYSIKNY